MPAGATVTYPLTAAGDLSFSGRAMLFPHDWRDLSGAVGATVTAILPDGRRRELWARTLAASGDGRPRGYTVQCAVPAGTAELALSIHPTGPATGSEERVTRAVWVDPVLVDPHAPAPISPAGVAETRAPAETPAPGHTATGPGAPLISVLTPVHDPPLAMLEEAIASVRNQTYAKWELCLVDDGSTNPEITAALEHHANSDPRIRLTRHIVARGISEATNAAMALATGDYIALLDHDDTLTPDALQHMADRITADPTLDMLYSDEDVIADDGSFVRHIKPGWSPDHMTALMYTCHLGRLPARPRRRARWLPVALRRLPGLRLRPAAHGPYRPRRPRPPDPLPLARPCRVDGRRGRGQALRLPDPAGRHRRASRAPRDRSRCPVRPSDGPASHRSPGQTIDHRRPHPGRRRRRRAGGGRRVLAAPAPPRLASRAGRPRQRGRPSPGRAHRRRDRPGPHHHPPRVEACATPPTPGPPITSCSCRPSPPASPTTG